MLSPLLIAGLGTLGLGIGFLAGLLGIGGGMLMVPFITAVLAARGVSADLAVKTNGGNVMINDAKVVKADIACKNGVIHVVAEGFTDLSAHLSALRDEPGAPAPRVRQKVSGRLLRSRDFH